MSDKGIVSVLRIPSMFLTISNQKKKVNLILEVFVEKITIFLSNIFVK